MILFTLVFFQKKKERERECVWNESNANGDKLNKMKMNVRSKRE